MINNKINIDLPKLIILDRDGVILKHVEPYILKWNDVSFIDGSIEAIRKIFDKNISVAVVTNQSPVQRGYITIDFVDEVNKYISSKFNNEKINFYICPHKPESHCNCRKPNPELLLKAMQDFQVKNHQCWMIGDADTDILAGKNAKVNCCINVLSGKQILPSKFSDYIFPNLEKAIDALL